MLTNQEILFHCAPTLANRKIGNIFSVKFDEIWELEAEIQEINHLFLKKSVKAEILSLKGNTALLYIYRPKKVSQVLSLRSIQDFLRTYGYDTSSMDSVLEQLRQNLQHDSFPHEIGVFLGYPLEDIRSFIAHEGKHFRLSGCWKVYHNLEQAKKQFALYQQCVDEYLRCYAEGYGMDQLTVAG